MYKLEKEYILFNVFSRLASCCLSSLLNNYSKLDALFAVSLININKEFYSKLLKNY